MSATHSHEDYLFGSYLAFERTFTSWVGIIIANDTYPELLRRNAIALWLSSLVEFASQSDKRNEAANDILAKNNSIQPLIDKLNLFQKIAKDILSKFNEDEQVLIWLIRNQSVHGHLSLYFHDDLGISIYDPVVNNVHKIKRTRNELYFAIESSLDMKPKPTERIVGTESFQIALEQWEELFSPEAIERHRESLFNTITQNA